MTQVSLALSLSASTLRTITMALVEITVTSDSYDEISDTTDQS